MTSYAIPGLVYDDDTPLTFEADDVEASKITFKQLIGLGWGNAELRRLSDAWEADDVEPSDPDDQTLHRWAWNYARHRLTNYDDLVREFSDEGGEWELCEACQVRASDPNNVEGYGLDVGCPECEGNMDEARESADEDINLLKLGVAAWVKTRWPQLKIDEDRSWHGVRGGFTDDELMEEVRDLTAVQVDQRAS